VAVATRWGEYRRYAGGHRSSVGPAATLSWRHSTPRCDWHEDIGGAALVAVVGPPALVCVWQGGQRL